MIPLNTNLLTFLSSFLHLRFLYSHSSFLLQLAKDSQKAFRKHHYISNGTADLDIQEDEPPAEATQDSIVAEGRKCMGENIHHQGNGFTEGINVQNGSRKIVNITR